ncbi:MAG: hypothetical protein QI197_01245 [Candidatus Korarchaeota archaeon]|nr:hypothetical protein [Candidatus Korarchaeota archaeon]
MRLRLGIPVARVVLGVEASTYREVGLCLDLFFSKWASSLDEFVPLLIPKQRCIEDEGRPHLELEPLVTPEEFVERFSVAYRRYAERVDDLRGKLLQVRRSYRFNLLIPPSPSQLRAEDMLVKGIGLIEGSVRGVNLVLGLDEWDKVEEMSLIAWQGNSMLFDVLSPRGYFRFGERSNLMATLIRSNPQLRDFLSSLTND